MGRDRTAGLVRGSETKMLVRGGGDRLERERSNGQGKNIKMSSNVRGNALGRARGKVGRNDTVVPKGWGGTSRKTTGFEKTEWKGSFKCYSLRELKYVDPARKKGRRTGSEARGAWRKGDFKSCGVDAVSRKRSRWRMEEINGETT